MYNGCGIRGNRMQTVTFSIVIQSNYDDAKKTIQSIESYTMLTKTIYVIDLSNQNKDSRQRMDFQWFISRYRDIEYIPMKRKMNVASAHDYVLTLLDSNYHIVLSCGTYIKEDIVTHLMDYMDTHLDCAVCMPKIVDSVGNIQNVYQNEWTLSSLFSSHAAEDVDYTSEFKIPVLRNSFFMIQTNLFKELQGFDTAFNTLEDLDFSKRVNEVGNIIYVPDNTVYCEKLPKLSFSCEVQGLLQYFRKWGWK